MGPGRAADCTLAMPGGPGPKRLNPVFNLGESGALWGAVISKCMVHGTGAHQSAGISNSTLRSTRYIWSGDWFKQFKQSYGTKPFPILQGKVYWKMGSLGLQKSIKIDPLDWKSFTPPPLRPLDINKIKASIDPKDKLCCELLWVKYHSWQHPWVWDRKERLPLGVPFPEFT